MSVYTTDPASICYVIVRRFGELRFLSPWSHLSPFGHWVESPHDAGLYTQEKAREHCKLNPARGYLPLSKAIRRHHISVNKLSLERKIQTC